MTEQSEILQVERKGDVEWVTLNRPDSLNALNQDLILQLRTYFEEKYYDDETRIIVLRASGRAFCAGLDLNDSTNVSRGVEQGLQGQKNISDIYKAMRRCPQPIISLVKGAACGGGFSLALASDIRILGESAKMNAAYLTIGTSGCDMGSSYFLPRLVGTSLASELLLTGRFIYAEEALQHRLVSKVVPDADLAKAADEMLTPMLAASKMGLRLTKDALNFSVDASSMEAAMAMEDRQQILLVLADTEFRERGKKFKK
ncbi:Enoyl-CoA hydratase/isomerase [marine gamma proteobacterium HTCC2143]|jgi:enoyl-CoA hydratase/carnithine racemase|uniref:Enoyl-CoA hydratase/isomerase n=1 Tax=marine gamma proteobacterium HTCC2143 TaxID=247633 RepID=A0YBB4_9GAMM|nr:Enoyl-CoA hydratase/isomerase [marine gamma proteobacterium HTCC2143]|tara:strand:+ start:218 stop:991 length:774 start_codon:yes stop_codon:yes gene_type:complete